MDAAVSDLLARVRCWADSRPDIIGLLLVGSQARGTAGPGSDIDLVLLSRQPQLRRRQARWVRELFKPPLRLRGWYDRTYGVVWSRHVLLHGLPPVELTFAGPEWAAIAPPDTGTAAVLRGGYRILSDAEGRLQRLADRLADGQASPGHGAGGTSIQLS